MFLVKSADAGAADNARNGVLGVRAPALPLPMRRRHAMSQSLYCLNTNFSAAAMLRQMYLLLCAMRASGTCAQSSTTLAKIERSLSQS